MNGFRRFSAHSLFDIGHIEPYFWEYARKYYNAM